jgi:hypothetical protein
VAIPAAQKQRICKVSHQDPMKFKPTDAEMEIERPEVFRILALRFAGGKKYREIADIEAIAVGTVKSRINRARTRIMAASEAAGLPMGDPATAMNECIERRKNTNNLDL